MNVLRIGIASYEEMKRRTLAIARGKLKPSALDPKVWFTSPESFARILSNRNRELLAVIAATRPGSLQELADSTGRRTSNLSRTLKTMERYGFVRLPRDKRGRIRPEVPYRSIALTLPLGQREDLPLSQLAKRRQKEQKGKKFYSHEEAWR